MQSRLGAVDLLRTIAFFAVVLCHFAGMLGDRFAPGSSARAWSDVFLKYGSAGTDAFFLLSAFLLCRSLTAGATWRQAVERRIARLYPAFLLVTIAYLVLSLVVPHNKIPTDPAEAALYVMANLLLLPGILPMQPLVTVSWSLSYLVFSYGAIGLLYRAGGLAQRPASQRVLLWMGVAAMAGALTAFTDFPHGRLIFFPLGALLAELAPYVRQYARLWATAPVLGAAILGVQANFWDHTAGLCLLIGGCVASPVLNRVAAAALMMDLARNSYAVFLTHGLVLRFLVLVNPPSMSSAEMLAVLLGGLALVVAAAMVANSLAFEPFTRWLHGRQDRKGTMVPGWRVA